MKRVAAGAAKVFMSEEASHFDIFGLQLAFDIDTEKLKESYLRLQREHHPDRQQNTTARLQAAHMAANLNQGYATLVDPLKRADYLLQLQGISLFKEQGGNAYSPAPELLMDIMERRQLLEDANDTDAIMHLEEQRNSQERECIVALSQAFAENNTKSAVALTHKLSYLKKMKQEIAQKRKAILKEASHATD